MKANHSSSMNLSLRCVLPWLLCALPVQASELLDIGRLPGTDIAEPYGINARGDVVVGRSIAPGFTAFRWTPSTGMVSLGMLNGGSQSSATAVNAMGDVVVGDATDGDFPGEFRAFRWTAATGMVSLETLTGGNASFATGVNAAGDVVVGRSRYSAAENLYHAFRWTAATGMEDLETLPSYDSSQAEDVNAKGDVIVGNASIFGTPDSIRAVRWTDAGIEDLGILGIRNWTAATAVNAIGDVVVGVAHDSTPSNSRAFRWTEATGTMEDLGTINGGSISSASDVNAAGNVVVGRSHDGDTIDVMRGFRWTRETGMQSVEQWLADNGVTVSSHTSATADGVSADGNVVTGRLSNNHAYIARVGGAGSGMIDVAAFNTSLMRVANAATLAQNNADLAMNGLHGNPMRGLLPRGRYSVWVSGDAGRQNSGQYDGDQGIAELGFAKSLTENLQFSVALGHNYRREHTGVGDTTTLRSTYVLPELTYRLPDTSLHATLSGYYSDGDMAIKRSYLNAGTPVNSTGKPSVSTAGARLRMDWLNAASWGRTAFTPYASLTYMRTDLSGYTERGGGFPARWDSRREHATTARIGLDAVYPLNSKVNVLGRLEAAHRFEDEAARVTGQVIGLHGFAFDDQRDKRNWLRAGVGLESKLLGGVGAVMLNATTQGGSSTYWLNASYRWVF